MWRIVDDLNAKARLLEDDAARLRVEAQRLNKVAAAIADGRPVEDELCRENVQLDNGPFLRRWPTRPEGRELSAAMKRCPSCGFLPLPDATHCPKCGKPIESSSHRRANFTGIPNARAGSRQVLSVPQPSLWRTGGPSAEGNDAGDGPANIEPGVAEVIGRWARLAKLVGVWAWWTFG